ncbi:MAG: phosphoglycerate kinase [Patescibacteria group bacterium]|nr:phosphoglycerate kinase [Patescibacteria group bacterium]
MKLIQDFNVFNKRVLVRCDFNVPLDEKGNILDDFRIRKTLPTIEYLIKNKAKIILISHLGRPVKELDKKKMSLKPVALRLGKLLGRNHKKIIFLKNCIGKENKQVIEKMKLGNIVILENLRFYKQEIESNLKSADFFAKKFVKIGDIYINDAFAVCHRKHSSIIKIPRYLPSGVGFLLQQELNVLGNLKQNCVKPFVMIIGGKKAKTKAKMINKISNQCDNVLIGHLIEKEIKRKKIKIREKEKIIVPIDAKLYNGKELDIGNKTIDLFKEKISKAKTIFWNGQLGMTEDKEFANGSLEIAKAIIQSNAHSVVGGGDTVAFLKQHNLRNKFDFISTGGGAMLSYLSSEPLPGIQALENFKN